MSQFGTASEHDVRCPMPGCVAPLHVIWTSGYSLFPSDLEEGEAPPEIVDHHTSSWRVECYEGHVVLLPGPVGCCDDAGNDRCGHIETEYDWADDERRFTVNDVRRLKSLIGAGFREGICGDFAPTLATHAAPFSAPVVCGLSHGHASPWHAVSDDGGSMRWTEGAAVPS